MNHITAGAPDSKPVEIRLRYPTEEGLLRVRARHHRGRWVVEARCGRWRQVSMGSDLTAVAEMALRAYASGTPTRDTTGPRSMRRVGR